MVNPSQAVQSSGYHLSVFDSVGSTSDILKDMAANGAPDRTAIRAIEQTGGRGRHGRGWASPPGNLYLSVLLRETVAPARLAELSFVAAVSMGEAIASQLRDGSGIRFKWPNDIMLAEAKVAGLLLEPGGFETGNAWVVIGSGVNVESHPPDTPYNATHIASHPTSISMGEGGRVEALMAEYLKSLNDWRDRWRRQGFAPIRAAWRAAAHRVGEGITVRLGQETLSGTFSDMDETGALVITMPDGGMRRITAGEVIPALNGRH